MTKVMLYMAFMLLAAACNQKTGKAENNRLNTVAAPEASEPVAADVLLVTHSPISGQLYSQPSPSGVPLIRFDTTQRIQVLDTTSDGVFAKARIRRDTTTLTGYIYKTILPEY